MLSKNLDYIISQLEELTRSLFPEILKIYRNPRSSAQEKKDGSPLTAADMYAHKGDLNNALEIVDSNISNNSDSLIIKLIRLKLISLTGWCWVGVGLRLDRVWVGLGWAGLFSGAHRFIFQGR